MIVMTASMTGRSSTRLELMPNSVELCGTVKGASVTDIPLTSTRLNTFAPTMLPRDKSLQPLTSEVMAVTSSGSRGTQRDKGQCNDRLGHAERLGDQGAVIHQQVCAHGDQHSAQHQQDQRPGQGHFLFFGRLLLTGGGFSSAIRCRPCTPQTLPA